MSDGGMALAIHGGAGALASADYGRELAHMRGLAETGLARLTAGASALDVVEETVAAMEASGLYVAGRGASPNLAGRYELDASIMEGRSRKAGAVAALVGFASPIAVARRVMEATPHVLIAGEGAAAFAAAEQMTPIEDPEAWFTHAGRGPAAGGRRLATGTVGAVARDASGALAAATSTAGVFRKMWGRVGDSPIVGAGVWADTTVAVSCTGQGEMFVRAAAAAQISWRMRLAGESLEAAAAAALADVLSLGGGGGLIAIDATGVITMPFNTEGMKRAAARSDGTIVCEVF